MPTLNVKLQSLEGPLYAQIERLKQKYSSNQSLVFLLEYCQGCIIDDLPQLPDDIIADEKHCIVKLIYEYNNGDYLHIHFREGMGDDVEIDCITFDKDKFTSSQDCGWNHAKLIIESW